MRALRVYWGHLKNRSCRFGKKSTKSNDNKNSSIFLKRLAEKRKRGDLLETIQKVLVCFFVTIAVFQDLKKGIISNSLILLGLLGGVVFQLLRFRWAGLILFLGSAAFPVLLFSLLYYFRMIGAGDIKLLAVLGGFLGIRDFTSCLGMALVFAGGLSLILMIRRKNLIERFGYFAAYVSAYQKEKKWKPYRKKGRTDGEFPLSLPIACSVWLFAAGLF